MELLPLFHPHHFAQLRCKLVTPHGVLLTLAGLVQSWYFPYYSEHFGLQCFVCTKYRNLGRKADERSVLYSTVWPMARFGMIWRFPENF